MNQNEQKKYNSSLKIQSVKFIQRSNGTIKGYSVNTFHGLVKNYNQDRVSIIMNITKPNFKGRWPRCSYFGVFDGHGGNKCSDFLKENMHRYITQNTHFPHEPIQALKFGFKKAQQQFLAYAQSQDPVQRSGSCAIVLLIIDQICYVANVGDSRAILSANMGKNVYPISKDHKPDSQTQKQRIFNAGGRIYQSSMKNKNGQVILGPFRIQPGKLSVSRSFGDIQAKLLKYQGNPKVLIAKPQITYFQINSQQHDFIVMCSDGVYDKLSNEQVSQCFWNQRQKNSQKDEKEKYQFIGHVPSKIIERSMQKLSMDNLTCLVIVFQDQGKLLLPSKSKFSKVTQKQYTKIRPQSSFEQDNIQNKNRFNNTMTSTTNNIKINGAKLLQQNKTSRSSKPQEISLQNNNRQLNMNDFLEGKQKQNINSNKTMQSMMLKRKSTSNLLTSKNNKFDSHQNNSLNSSTSAKMIGMKGLNKPNKIAKEGLMTDKININDFLQKKKSMDYIRRQNKDSLWKQIISTNKIQKNDKIIRF